MGALAATLLAGAAVAQPLSLRDHLFGSQNDERAFNTPNVARFVPDDGGSFILDRSAGRQVFLKFDDSPEIWALDATPGPRGDIIYKNDMGEPVLRASRLGGLTLFTSDRPSGVAAAFVGQGSTLRPPPMISYSALLQTFAQAANRAGRAAGRSISFEAEDVPLAMASLFADAAIVVSEAYAELSSQGDRKKLQRFAKVRFELGRKNGAAEVKGDTLRITIAPDKGLAGRPSSHRVAAVLAKR
jgi:hypothetical protein